MYGDCAVNVEPSAEELALIAVTSAETAAAFGVTPRVAMLSYSTGVSGAGPQVLYIPLGIHDTNLVILCVHILSPKP